MIWNCQGLRKGGKFECLKELMYEESIEFIGLQETNRKDFDQSWLDALCGNKSFIRIHSPPNGRSRGSLVSFDSEIFDVREKEIGEFMLLWLVFHKKQNVK